MVASSSRRSVVVIAAVLISASVGERGGEADDQPDAPRPVDVGRVDRVEVLAAAHRPHAGMVGGVARERPPGGRAAGDEQRRVGGDGGVAPGDGGVEQDVAEAGGAVVDRGHAERGAGRVGHPDGHGVADLQVAAVREHAADGDGVVVDVAQRPLDHDRVERARRRACRSGRGRPRALVAEAGGERIDLGRHDGGDGVDAVEPPTAAAVPAGSGAPSAPTTTCAALTRAPCHVLGVALVAGLDDALGAGEHRHEHDRRRQRGGPPAVRRQPGARRAVRTRRGGAAARRARRPGSRAASARGARCPSRAGSRRGRRTPSPRSRRTGSTSPRRRARHATPADARGPTPAADARSRPRAARRPAGCARRGEPRRRPRAGRSRRPCRGRHERHDRVRRRERRSDLAAIREDVDDEVRERAARDARPARRRRARRAALRRRSAGGSARGVAPRARSTAVSRRRWAIARANVPATTNRATAPAMPPSAPKMAISPARSAAVGSPASASAACRRSRTSIPCPRRSCRRPRRTAAEVPGSAITPIALTRPGAPDSAAATAGGKNTAAWLSSPAPRASARPLTR